LECFDSLGIDLTKRELLKLNFRYKNVNKIEYNVTQVQSSLSDTCGYFVLYFIVNRFHNLDLSFSDLLNEIFVESQAKNETFVKEFAVNHFHKEHNE